MNQASDKSITVRNKKTGETQEFIWDETKERRFMSDYCGLDFTAVAYIFFDKSKVVTFDTKHDDKEDRFQIIGKATQGDWKLSDGNNTLHGRKNENEILFVISTEPHLDSNKPIRIISARPAENKEKYIYNTQNNLIGGIRETPKKLNPQNREKDKNKQVSRENKLTNEGKENGQKRTKTIQKLYKNYTKTIQKLYKNYTKTIQKLYKNYTKTYLYSILNK